jgi:putative SOS response-associated peptidase YedK
VCGRYVSASTPDDIAAYFDAEAPEVAIAPSWNVAPTDDVYAVRNRREGDGRRIDAFHWGLVPSWAKDPKIGSRMINARSETLAEKAAFKAAFLRRRCLVPADGFYEWTHTPGAVKQPHFIHRPDGEPYAFAGLWEVWRRDADDPWLRSCSIVTTTANEPMSSLHDRMPVMLPRRAWDAWLDPANDDLASLGRLLVPAPDGLIEAHPVSTLVNSVRNQGPELVVPVEPATAPDTLFG